MKRLFLVPAVVLIASSAFAQSSCVTTPVNITGNRVTLTSSGAKSVSDNQTYIYYERNCHRRHHHNDAVPMAATLDEYSSKPLLLTDDKTVRAVPESYNVSLSTPESNVAVCPDSTLNLNADINVERVASYTGNYPDNTTDRTYKKVSKRDYMMARRKMYKIERKEARVMRKAHTDVDVRSNNV
jgi:hypothetical protein